MDKEKTGEYIRNLRKKKGWTQMQLAEQLHISDKAVSKWERGTEYPNGKLTMATNAQFEPYEYYDGDNVVGIDADIAKAICDKLGYDLEIEDMEFDAIIAAVSSGKADFGAAGMTVKEDRLKNIDFTDTYATASQVIVVRNK